MARVDYVGLLCQREFVAQGWVPTLRFHAIHGRASWAPSSEPMERRMRRIPFPA